VALPPTATWRLGDPDRASSQVHCRRCGGTRGSMKTVLVHVEGELKAGDILMVSWSNIHAGGRNTARYDVPQPLDTIQEVNGEKKVVTQFPTMAEAVRNLANMAGRFDGYSARQRNERELVIQCSDSSDQVRFWGESTGDQVITVEDLA